MTNRFYTIATAAVLAVACRIGFAADPVAPPAKPADPAAAAAPVKLSKEESSFFESKVRPVLAANCYKCHSAESGKSKGGLVLDTREGVLKGGENGAILVPGSPEKSKLITAIGYNDSDLQMPPKGEKLSPKEIADLTQWVKMGAPDPRTSAGASGTKLTGLTDKARAHWAYQPVKDQPVPSVQNAKWVRTPVDAFVLAKLEQAEMKPSPQAAKEALIRRATFDLIGLPPTPEEVRAFVQDQSPNAFEKVVDRLLASPHYGERWGRFWLDSARYSDTTGAENNNRKEDYRYPYAWTYRDYVIRSFNDDKPYDRFLMEQIAADLMPDASKDPQALAGLGFLTVGKRFQNPNDTIDERIDTLSKATMAMTVACARCHDHKFDPIPTADYYSLHGIFVSTIEPADKPMIGAAPTGPAYADFLAKMADLEQRNRDIYYNYIQTKSTEFRAKASAYLLTTVNYRKNSAEAIQARNKLIQEEKLDRDLYQGLRIRPNEHTFILPLMRFGEIPADNFQARAKVLLDEIKSGRINRRPINPIVVQAFKKVDPDSLKSLRDVTDVYGAIFKDIAPQADVYLKAARTAKTAKIDGFADDLVELINFPAEIEPAARLDMEHLKLAVAKLPSQNNQAYQRFQFNAVNELQLTHPGAPARAMVVADALQPRNSPVFIRGEAQNRGPLVPHQFLEILAGKNRQPFKGGSGRLELAKAIATKDNPLTARVAINRIWLHHFGDGFVRTPDDLGVQSELPSHPELLDYLASRFVESGWSVKKMHKLIMLSAAYQQSSDTNPAYAAKDPANRLLWRANLRRLDFEAIRDSMLQFTGKLDPTIGGKPVNLTEEPYSNRRSVYGYIDRGDVPELMEQFDFADPDMANTKRTTTIVPQQALFFMNSPMAVDVARKVTSRPEFTSATDDAGRVRAIYQVLFQRNPRPEEVKFAADFYNAKVIADREKLATATPPPTAGKFRPGAAGVSDDERMRRQLNKQLQQKAKAGAGQGRNNGKAPIRNDGDIVERKPLTVWEEYAQALLFTNEIAYTN